jgi:chromosome segregation ATPase
MEDRAELEKRRTLLLQTRLGVLYAELNASKVKLEELETEYDLVLDHCDKLAENIAFLKHEAPVVKLKEYKQAVESHETAKASLNGIVGQIELAKNECRRGLRQVEFALEDLKYIEATLNQEAKLYVFPNDRRRDQDAD